jgi:hypothetical protein
MNCWPVCSDSHWQISRPAMSIEPPAANGTITRTGFAG